jgi:hypothetical protein
VRHVFGPLTRRKPITEAQAHDEARAAITPIADQLLELQTMSFKDLRHRWQEVYGEPAHSVNVILWQDEEAEERKVGT